MTFDPSASSIASRSDPRPRVSRCDRRSVEPGDKRCPGVFEPGLRSPPPHRWRATPRLTGLSGRCVCIRSGSLRRRSAPIALEPATIEGLFPSFCMEPRIHAMRANSGARRQVVRQQGRLVAKTGEASPRYATSCRDLVQRSRKVELHESEERLQSSEREASPRVSSLQSEGVLDRGDPGLSRGTVRESVLVGCERKPSKKREGRSKPTTGTRGGTRRAPWGIQRPSTPDPGSTEARTAT